MTYSNYYIKMEASYLEMKILININKEKKI